MISRTRGGRSIHRATRTAHGEQGDLTELKYYKAGLKQGIDFRVSLNKGVP